MLPCCLPAPLTSTTVTRWIVSLSSASLTSSNLNGLMTASIFFINRSSYLLLLRWVVRRCRLIGCLSLFDRILCLFLFWSWWQRSRAAELPIEGQVDEQHINPGLTQNPERSSFHGTLDRKS